MRWGTIIIMMKRIVIVGSGGSGKSTLAKQIGSLRSLDVTHLDSLFWKPGWIRASAQEQQSILDEIINRASWIIEGDHMRTQSFRFAVADTIIFLDFPRSVCLWRTTKPFIQNRGTSRLGMAAGCPERLHWTLLNWVWRYPQDNRPKVIENIERCAKGRRIIILRRPQDTRQFVADLVNTDPGRMP